MRSHPRSVSASTCCSVCSGGRVPIARLDILTPGKAKSSKRKRQAIRDVSDSMKHEIKEALRKEWLEYARQKIVHTCL